MFGLNESQLEKLEDWQHSKKQVYTGAIGGRYTYQFTPTNVGCIVTVIDNVDKTELSLSEYESW